METEAHVLKVENCDYCKTPIPAEYDFKTKTGAWAFGCAQHWEEHRLYTGLGIGKGQRLIQS